MTRFPEDVIRLQSAFALPESESPERASLKSRVSAVLIPLFDVDGDTTLLFTRRALTLSSHPGEVSFPGGRVDPEDESPRAAALREAEEEVGIRREDVTVLGHLCDYMTYRGILVCAYVAQVDAPLPTSIPSPDEVAEILPVPARDLLRRDVYEARLLDGSTRERVVHYWHLPQATIWGITGEITARFLTQAYGWRPPAAPRVIHDLAQFLPEHDGSDPTSRG